MSQEQKVIEYNEATYVYQPGEVLMDVMYLEEDDETIGELTLIVNVPYEIIIDDGGEVVVDLGLLDVDTELYREITETAAIVRGIQYHHFELDFPL